MDFADEVLEFAKTAVKVGKQIAVQVTDWLAKNLFEIRLLELNGKFTKEFDMCVGLKVDCTIIGITINYSGEICINPVFWGNLGKDLADERYPGVKKQEQDIEKLEGKFREFDQDKEDLGEEEKKIDRDVHNEVSRDQKRAYVPTAEEAYYRRLAEEPLPAVVTRGAETVNVFKTSAPWVLVQDYDARSFDHTPHPDLEVPAEKRTLHEGILLCSY